MISFSQKKFFTDIAKAVFVFSFLAFAGGCETVSPVKTGVPERIVRTAVLKGVDHVIVNMRGRYKVIDPVTQQVLEQGRRLRATKIAADSQGILFKDKRYLKKRIRLVPSKDVGIQLGRREKRYRGSVDIIRDEKKGLLVINRLGLEDYVRGILYHEASHRWPMEALNAQAVTARTYALYQMGVNADQEYDVTSDIYSQVYGGRSAERYRTNLAVKRTEGHVLLFKGKIFPSYYHATCGGETEDVRELWEHDDLPPLRGVRCNFCVMSPHYRWKKNFRSKEIQDALTESGRRVGAIKDISVSGRSKSGRIRDLKITTRDGKQIIIAGKDFRNIIGPNKVKSNNYRVVMKGYYFDLIGQGWGHGVGMCQWGAYGMARQRHTYETILRYYYPGAEIGGL